MLTPDLEAALRELAEALREALAEASWTLDSEGYRLGDLSTSDRINRAEADVLLAELAARKAASS